jgi:Cytochrome oxidase complex assembly protein 1
MSNPPYPIIPAPIVKSWKDRHPGWTIALAASLVVGLLVVFLCFIFGIVEYSFKHSDVYHMALERAGSNPEAAERLGNDIHAGWIWQGNINLHNSDGYANMTIPIAGSKGAGQIHLVAKKRAGLWSFDHLEFEPESGSGSINLLPPATNQ